MVVKEGAQNRKAGIVRLYDLVIDSKIMEQGMINGVQDIFYNVQDMAQATRFYTEILGMKLIESSDWWTSLEIGGVRIGLHWTEGEPIPEIPHDAHGAHAGGTLTLKSSDVAADRKRLESAGAKILGESDQPWGHMLVFRDLDGNILKLMRAK
jgi:catechol-2,3-dioxygenase